MVAEAMADTDGMPEPAIDAGATETGRGPVRRCLATGERRTADRLIRFVLGPGNRVVPDLAAKLPGRGMWLSADARSIKTALDRKLFARAARTGVQASSDLAERVEALLVRRCVETLSLARRAGEAVCGFEKTRAALAGGRAAVLVRARDGAADGGAKLAAAARSAGRSAVPVVAVLDAAEIGEAFGRDASVHAALAPGGLSRHFLMEAGRLTGFRKDDG